MDRLESGRMFVAVMETGSFTVAVARLGTSSGQASTLVSRLESELGVRLLNRTTRAVSATEAGQAYFRVSSLAVRPVGEIGHSSTSGIGCAVRSPSRIMIGVSRRPGPSPGKQGPVRCRGGSAIVRGSSTSSSGERPIVSSLTSGRSGRS